MAGMIVSFKLRLICRMLVDSWPLSYTFSNLTLPLCQLAYSSLHRVQLAPPMGTNRRRGP